MMTDEHRALLNEFTRCQRALGQVLTLCAMPKKTEAGVQQIYMRMSKALNAPSEPEHISE